MRKFEFRFWDKDLKKMSYRQPLAYDFTHPNIVPMQFTGAKDKSSGDLLSEELALSAYEVVGNIHDKQS